MGERINRKNKQVMVVNHNYRRILEEHKMTQGRQSYLIEQYKAVKPQLRKQLAQTLFHPPKVVDVDWRLDYFLKANSVEKINVPIYRIVLQVT
jgi:hypothetical protein